MSKGTDTITSALAHYLVEKVLIKSLESRVILRFFYAHEMKNVKKGKECVEPILIIFNFLVSLYLFQD